MLEFLESKNVLENYSMSVNELYSSALVYAKLRKGHCILQFISLALKQYFCSKHLSLLHFTILVDLMVNS